VVKDNDLICFRFSLQLITGLGQKRKLIIEFKHPLPGEYAADLRQALCTALRVLHSDAAREVPALNGHELCNCANPITELLQQIIVSNTEGMDVP
jgi:hypothetical protein